MYAAEYASQQPDQPAIVMAGSGEVVTFAGYEAQANQIAHLFRAEGLRRGDHVAFFMENNPRLLTAEGGAERTGLLYTLINAYLQADETAHIINDCQAQVVITSSAKLDVARELPRRCPEVRRWLMTGTSTPPPPYECLEDALARFPIRAVEDEQLGAPMLYSSGTTGQPKGVLRPVPDSPPGVALPIIKLVTQMFGMRPGMVYLSPAPLYHSAPQGSVTAAIRLGATSVIMERFDAEQFLRLVQEHRVTHTQLVPTMFSRLLRVPAEVRQAADLSTLEVVLHAGAPCPVPVKERMIDWLGPIVVEYYAATEANGFTRCDSHEWLDRKGTVGRPVGAEIFVLDEDGNRCPPGKPGTIWFAGSTSFQYFNDPEKTAEALDATGRMSTVNDVGYVDEDGYLYLTDRKTHMIISGGVNIYPQETENLLITHPKVADAAVFGVPNEDLGEEVKAVVELVDDIDPAPELESELIAFCRQHLAHMKCPRTVDFEESLPRLPTGKLYKRVLRDRYWQGHKTGIV